MRGKQLQVRSHAPLLNERVLTESSAEQAQHMLQGVGSRFDFHINKTLCDLRLVSFLRGETWLKSIRISEIFDIIIDFPDSMGALKDLKVRLVRVVL